MLRLFSSLFLSFGYDLEIFFFSGFIGWMENLYNSTLNFSRNGGRVPWTQCNEPSYRVYFHLIRGLWEFFIRYSYDRVRAKSEFNIAGGNIGSREYWVFAGEFIENTEIA